MLKRPGWVAGAAALSIAVALKAFYSTAGAGDLVWILGPSSWLARVLGGIDLAWEPGAGYISHTYRLIVGPSCAGINFGVIAFLALYFSFAGRRRSRWRWLASSMVLAFAAAIVANAVRIVVSAHLWDAAFYLEWLTGEEMHRAAGTLIYYGALIGLWAAVDSGTRARAGWIWLVPFSWYVGISLGVPVAHRVSIVRTDHFREHAAWVLGILTLVTLIVFLGWIVASTVRKRALFETRRIKSNPTRSRIVCRRNRDRIGDREPFRSLSGSTH